MKLAYQTNTWGGVVGAPSGVTSIKDLYYLTYGSTEEAAKDISEAGYAGFEVFDGNIMPYAADPQKFQAMIKKLGLKLVAVYSGANFIFDEIWPEEKARLESAASAAAILGAEHFVVGGGALRQNGNPDSDYAKLAKRLDEVVDIAERHKLIASYHPHLGTLSQSPEGTARVFQLSRINFCPDTAHIQAGGGDPAGMIKQFGDRIKYVHLKDLIKEPFGFAPLGKGCLDWKAILTALKTIQYQGWVTVELDSYEGSNKEAALLSYRFLEHAEKKI